MTDQLLDVTGQIWVADDDTRRRVVAALDEAGLFNIKTQEARHVVMFSEAGWSIAHPVACRPDLLSCEVHHRLENALLVEERASNGRYIVDLGPGESLTFTAVDE